MTNPCGIPASILDRENSEIVNNTLCFVSFMNSVGVLKILPDAISLIRK